MDRAEDLVEYEVRDGIAHIRFNRPEKLNAVTDDMALRFRELLFELDDDESAKVGIIYGNGRAFCAGADVNQRLLRPMEELKRFNGQTARGASFNDHFFGFSQWKPLIGAVHGYIIGAGIGLALRCDLLVAAESSKFRIAEVPLGLPVAKFWEFLVYLGGGSFATDVTLTGRYFSGKEALDHGIVNRLVPDGEQLAVAESLARDIIALPPLGVRATVRHRRFAIEGLQVRANGSEAEALRFSADFRESAKAWTENRNPIFRGE